MDNKACVQVLLQAVLRTTNNLLIDIIGVDSSIGDRLLIRRTGSDGGNRLVKNEADLKNRLEPGAA
ncbi:MAG TPA: hypothetical protein DEV81_08850, partial [Cyanobacteria bacterium UBA11049]|nr:hypothetical protein [Cyanobacteria bacterium UBA11049]